MTRLDTRATASEGPGRRPCACDHTETPLRYIVLTGGPGGGKTAVLDVARERFCRHVRVLGESASIIFGGGFPRTDWLEARKAAQRAIYHVQVELETWATGVGDLCVALCDRGRLDGLAYWPGDEDEYFEQIGSNLEAELAKYAAVIHLRTPKAEHYNHANPLRVESPAEAARIDERILNIWEKHPNYVVIENEEDFFDKAQRALAVVEATLPECCRDYRRGGPRQMPGD